MTTQTPGPNAHILQAQSEIEERRDILRSGSAVLCFSGGKDSAACLLLLRPYLAEIHVLFVNTGRHYPETMAIVERAKAMCPKWLEVRTDRDGQWAANGLPSDLVPIDWTNDGQMFSGDKPVKVQSYLQCCFQNISLPALRKAQEIGATLLIRGQRNDEGRKAPSRTGTLYEGLTFWHPIERWTRWQTLDYVRDQLGELPRQYTLDHTSLDCYDCTGFSRNAHDRAHYTRTHHPALHREYIGRLVTLHGAMREQMNHYEAILQAGRE